VGFPGARGGWIGVDMFFVLSGFLITTLLVAEQRRTGTVHLGKFWGRRFLRLMPAYWLYIGGVTLAILLEGPLSPASVTRTWPTSLYVASLWGYFVNYLPLGGMPWKHYEVTSHLWSLAVEEQFYFAWPLLASVALRWQRPWILAWSLVVVLAAYGLWARPNMFHLDARGVGIMMGCAAALSLAASEGTRLTQLLQHRALRIGWSVATLLVLIPYWAFTLNDSDSIWIARGWFFGICAMFTGLTVLLAKGPQDALRRTFSFGPLVYLGKISYGLYLYHVLAQHLVWRVWLDDVPISNIPLRYLVRVSCFAGLSLLMAVLSYHFFEQKFLALKDRLR
jgi:peptidoglycan/LPS O-acetylase OafA/YrhL